MTLDIINNELFKEDVKNNFKDYLVDDLEYRIYMEELLTDYDHD